MLLLLLAGLAHATTTTDAIDETDAVFGDGGNCSHDFDALEAEAVYSFVFTQAEIAALESITLTLEYRRQNCLVELDDVEIFLDSTSLFYSTIGVSSEGTGETAPAWYTATAPTVADIGDLVVSAGSHEVRAVITGGGTNDNNGIRVTLVADWKHGTDWDSDGYDDDRLFLGDDCDDNDATINPMGTEMTGDEVDQDCDGEEVCFVDADDDGWRLTTTVDSSDTDCSDPGEALASDPTLDCDDDDDETHPDATEIVGDGKDQDCDTEEICYVDADDDGWRLDSTVVSTDEDCTDSGEALASDPTLDCDDADDATYPDATEVIGDEKDQSCDGEEICYADLDDDTWRTSDTVVSADEDCTDTTEATAADPDGDCYDDDPDAYPGATEVIGDGKDQDCDTEEICYADLDDDGWRTSDTVVSFDDEDCTDTTEATLDDPDGDCDDDDPDAYPGATEIAYDGIDQDCLDGDLCDVDEDGFDAMLGSCGGTDCNDDLGDINPGADEIWYDGTDQDCNGLSDFDQDQDGFDSIDYDGDDCDDLLDTVYPGAEEIWYDGTDQDCDGNDDDKDQDGYPLDDDCDDEDATAFPGARGWTEDCEWTVEDDGSRVKPELGGPPPSGCSCDAVSGPGSLAWLGLFGLLLGLRRRR